MRSPVLREFHTEGRVIMEERRLRTETSAPALPLATHYGAAFTDHPHGVTPTGYPEDLLRLSRREVEARHRRHCGPGQTTVAIVGRFDAIRTHLDPDRMTVLIPGDPTRFRLGVERVGPGSALRPDGSHRSWGHSGRSARWRAAIPPVR